MDSSALASAESWVYWIGIAKLVATFLVLAGVVIQLGGDWIVRPYEKVINDARNLQIAQLRSDAEKAGAAIADANARAQEAQARALQAQVELEKYKTPRSFKLGELSAIAAAAANFPGVTLHIFIASGTTDAVSLADALKTALGTAHWSVTAWTWTGPPAIAGSGLFLRSDADANTVEAARALSAALAQTELSSDVLQWPGDWDHFVGFLGGPTFNSANAQLRLVIGSKPQ